MVIARKLALKICLITLYVQCRTGYRAIVGVMRQSRNSLVCLAVLTARAPLLFVVCVLALW
jgi:hypothetical protein